MLLERDRSARTIAISQEALIQSILARFNLLTKSLPRAPHLSNPITPVLSKALGSPQPCGLYSYSTLQLITNAVHHRFIICHPLHL